MRLIDADVLQKDIKRVLEIAQSCDLEDAVPFYRAFLECAEKAPTVDITHIDQGYAKIAQKLWTYICIIDDTKVTYEELADAIQLTDDELALCRKLENADTR